MFTKQFKVTLGVFGIVVIAGIGAAQLTMQQEIVSLENRLSHPQVVKVIVTPTTAPTATPSAALKPVYHYSYPTKPVVK